jgi:hypothetical protein
LRRADSTVRHRFIFPRGPFSPDGGSIWHKPVYAMLRFGPESLSTPPNKPAPMKTRLILALSLALLAGAHAAPITLEMTLDTKRHGTAVVSGDLEDTKFPAFDFGGTKFAWSGGYYHQVSLVFAKVGTNWNVWGEITWEFYYTAADVFVSSVYDLNLRGQHMVPADPGEAANGLAMFVYHDNLNGSTTVPPNSDLSDTYPHLAGTHADTMTLTVPDLNGDALPGVIASSGNFAASVELYHVPESGSTLLWCGVCCAGAAWLSRSRRYRR